MFHNYEKNGLFQNTSRPPTITTPLLVIQTYQVTNIIVNDPTTLFWSTICYHHRGWLTRLRRIYGAPADEIKIYYSVYVHRITQYDYNGAVITASERYICMFASGVRFLANVVHGPPFIPMIHMICMHTKYQVLSTTYTNNILHINYPVTDSMTPNDRDINI